MVDFEQEEIEAFVDKWTSAIEQTARGRTPVAAEQALQERRELLLAVDQNPGVHRLASNPLLLTILALMKRQGVTLPERRVELYRNYVDTLLKHWRLARSLGRPPSRELDVVETLRVLAPLALWMHEVSPGLGLVKQEEMRRRLEALFGERGVEDPEKAATQFLSDVRDHAGLLVERGPREFGFIHLTFQEYLAAVAIAQKGQLDVEPVVNALADHAVDPNWHEVSLLTISYLGIIQQHDQVASIVIDRLIERSPGRRGQAVVLAGECVLDAWPGGVLPECRRTTVQKVLETMRSSNVEVALVTRAAAGQLLSRLGDPRTEVLDPLNVEWCDVLAGSFLMGSSVDPAADYYEQPQHKVEISYDYRIARYPVTNAQYEVFVDSGGYGQAEYWCEAENDGVWRDGYIHDAEGRERLCPADYGEPFNLENHPVVGVTWYEAIAFTRWLTRGLLEHGTLRAGWHVRLPTESEWEKAARGADRRIYPWADSLTQQQANYAETGIGATSAVGCFPLGASQHHAEEMSGNVWEWTSTHHMQYPYVSCDGRERLDAGTTIRRVLRGGSFGSDSRGVRCAARNGDYPNEQFKFYGFRVMLSPSLNGPD